MIQLAPELIHLIIKFSLQDLNLLPNPLTNSPSYSGHLFNLSTVSYLFSELSKIELFKKLHVVREKNGKLLMNELIRLGWEDKIDWLEVGIDQTEKEEWCEDLIRISPNLKTLSRQNLQIKELWTLAPNKPNLTYLESINNLNSLTFKNLYNLTLPSTSNLINLTELNLLNIHLPCLQNLFKFSPIKKLSILNTFLPIPHKSLEIFLTGLSITVKEFSFFVPRNQVGINHLRETICYLLPDLLVLRAAPSFLFSSAGIGLGINLPSKLIKLEILNERYFGDVTSVRNGIGGGSRSDLKEIQVLNLLNDMERLKELALEKDWSSSNVEGICMERGVGLVAR